MKKTVIITAERSKVSYQSEILVTYAFNGIGSAFYTDEKSLFEALRNEKRMLVNEYGVRVLFDIK